MKSESSSAQEIEFLRSLASMEDAFLRQSVSKQRQSKIKDFFRRNFYALWNKISNDTDCFCLKIKETSA